MKKIRLLSVGNVKTTNELVQELKCKIGAIPSSYSGLSLGNSFRYIIVWDCVEERMLKRLAILSSYLGLPLGTPFRSIVVWDGVERIRKRLAMWKR